MTENELLLPSNGVLCHVYRYFDEQVWSWKDRWSYFDNLLMI